MEGERPDKPKLNPRAALLLGVLGVSLSSIFVRYSEAPSLVTATGRLLWALAILTPIAWLRCKKELLAAKAKDIALCGLSGVLLALHFAVWFESLKRTTVASSTALVATEVIFSALGYALLLGGRIPKAGMAGIAVTFLGSVAIAAAAGGAAAGTLVGDGMALLAAVFVAGYTLIGRVQRSHMSTLAYTWFTYLASTLTLLALDLATGTPLLGWGWREVVICLFLGVFCTLLGHSVFSWCLKYLNPAYVASMKLCEPVFAAALAAVLFGEIPGALQAAGALLVIGGILLYTWADAKAAKQGQAPQTEEPTRLRKE